MENPLTPPTTRRWSWRSRGDSVRAVPHETVAQPCSYHNYSTSNGIASGRIYTVLGDRVLFFDIHILITLCLSRPKSS